MHSIRLKLNIYIYDIEIDSKINNINIDNISTKLYKYTIDSFIEIYNILRSYSLNFIM